jgi:hypothetical protein
VFEWSLAATLGSLGGYIGRILGDFGVTLGICRRLWMTFGTLWGHFGVMMCICGGLEGPFSIRSLPASIFWRVSIEVFTFLKALPLFFHKYMPPLVGPKSEGKALRNVNTSIDTLQNMLAGRLRIENGPSNPPHIHIMTPK